MLPIPLRAVGYRRVSSQEQTEGYSLDAQTTHIQNFIQSQGWSLVQFYTDAGISAKKGSHRPAFEQMLKDAQKGGFDVIVVDKIDRFYRHLTGLLTALDQLNGMGVSLASVQEKLDLTTPWGKLMLTVLGMLAEIYIDNLRQETKKGHRQRARAGLWGGEIPFGYCRGLCSDCKHPNGKDYCPNYGHPNLSDGKHMIAHPVESIGVKLMFEWYATGETSMSAIADKLTGYKVTLPDGTEIALRQKGHAGHQHKGPFSKDVVRNILGCITYTGKIGYIGTDDKGKFRSRRKPIEIYQGQQPALVSQELFDKVKELRPLLGISSMNMGKRLVRCYPLTGILKCGYCGSNMRGLSWKGKYFYYACGERIDHLSACKTRFQRAFETEDRIAGIIREVVSRVDQAATFELSRQQLLKAEERYRRAQELYLDAQIDRDQYDQELESYETSQKALHTEQLYATIALLDFLRAELSRWDALSPIEKKRLLRMAFEGAWVRENAFAALQPTIAFLPILVEIGLSTCGESGIRTHGGDKPHNGFRDRPIRPLWHLSMDCRF
jgi:DNA invertase Pin-like site-specific DNA recombinase